MDPRKSKLFLVNIILIIVNIIIFLSMAFISDVEVKDFVVIFIQALTVTIAAISIKIALDAARQNLSVHTNEQKALADRTTFQLIQSYINEPNIVKLVDDFRVIRTKEVGDGINDPTESKFISFDKYHAEFEASIQSSSSSRSHNTSTDYEVILRLLNFYEAIAIGIKTGALNRNMVEQWWRPTFVLDFIDLYAFIDRYRTKKDLSSFCAEAEKLVEVWATPHQSILMDKQKLLARSHSNQTM